MSNEHEEQFAVVHIREEGHPTVSVTGNHPVGLYKVYLSSAAETKAESETQVTPPPAWETNLLSLAIVADGVGAWLLHRFGPDTPEGKEGQCLLNAVKIAQNETSELNGASAHETSNEAAALRRVIERHARWRETALGFLKQVIDGRGTEDEWPALAEFVERSESRISEASSDKASARRCTCDNDDPFVCKCKESREACICMCHGL